MIDNPGVISLFILTLLLCIGLLFFIKASVKDRTEEVTWIANATEEELLPQIQSYFHSRAYHIAHLDRQTQQITFEGVVRPSWFMAIFLTILAAMGLLCAELVFATLWSDFPAFLWIGVGFAPFAGLFYWRGAERTEQVQLQVQPLDPSTDKMAIPSNSEAIAPNIPNIQSLIAVKAHRDELAQLQKALASLSTVLLSTVEAESL